MSLRMSERELTYFKPFGIAGGSKERVFGPQRINTVIPLRIDIESN